MDAQPQADQAQAAVAPQERVPEVDATPMEITISLPTQAYFLSGIRDFVINLTKNMTDFSEQWAFRFQAVVDELCNNAIEHGSAPGQKIIVTLLSTPGKCLEVIVRDTGTGPEKMMAEQMRALFEERRKMTANQFLGFRGRGLPKIVGEWTDEIVFQDVQGGGLQVRVKKYLRKDEEAVSSAKNDPNHLVLN